MVILCSSGEGKTICQANRMPDRMPDKCHNVWQECQIECQLKCRTTCRNVWPECQIECRIEALFAKRILYPCCCSNGGVIWRNCGVIWRNCAKLLQHGSMTPLCLLGMVFICFGQLQGCMWPQRSSCQLPKLVVFAFLYFAAN